LNAPVQNPLDFITEENIMSENLGITITMVGPRGVGKTSLLAAMYNELEAELGECGCTLTQAAGPTAKAINKQLRELKKMAAGSGIKVQEGEGIGGNSKERKYIFKLEVGDNGDSKLELRFVDLPGGWYTGEGEYEKADELLIESHVSILAVDAVALMEQPNKDMEGVGKYHEDINAPQDNKESYKRVSFRDGHTVIVTLIRAETYVQSGRTEALIEKTQKAYKQLASHLGNKDIEILGCYVETVGSLLLNSIAEREGMIESHFIRQPKTGYRPSRCGIPFRIAAGRALDIAEKKAGEDVDDKNNLWNKIREWFNRRNDLSKAKQKKQGIGEASEKLKANIKKTDFFDITP